MMWLCLLSLEYLSWALLCFATRRAYEQHFGTTLTRVRQRVLRTAGWLTALLAYGCGIAGAGWSIGSVNACAAWMLAAVIWVLLKTLRPRAARRLAYAAPITFLLTLVASVATANAPLFSSAFFGAP